MFTNVYQCTFMLHLACSKYEFAYYIELYEGINIFLDHRGLCHLIILDKVCSLRVSHKKPKKMPVFPRNKACLCGLLIFEME